MKKPLFIILLLINTLLIRAQEEKQDTLFIKYDKTISKRLQNPVTKEFYYTIKDLDKKPEITYFKEKRILKKLKTRKKQQCLKNIIKKSGAYYRKDRLIDSKLFAYFKNDGYKVYFLVKNKTFIEVEIWYEIN
ncbi:MULTISPECIES: hypothetical protein [Tenacibaculum]|uniref:hypothetical protein n=1 Tax=Tenacibaculum TaxID=104267 RepID=UPI00249210DD|nr:hypothetical protein [Tenacibaculum mesophilum]